MLVFISKVLQHFCYLLFLRQAIHLPQLTPNRKTFFAVKKRLPEFSIFWMGTCNIGVLQIWNNRHITEGNWKVAFSQNVTTQLKIVKIDENVKLKIFSKKSLHCRPPMRALISGKSTVFEQLLSSVSDEEKHRLLSSQTRGGATLLHLLAIPSTIAVSSLQMMLDWGADPLKTDETGQTFVHWLVRKQRVSLLRNSLDCLKQYFRQRNDSPKALQNLLDRLDSSGHAWVELFINSAAAKVVRQLFSSSFFTGPSTAPCSALPSAPSTCWWPPAAWWTSVAPTAASQPCTGQSSRTTRRRSRCWYSEARPSMLRPTGAPRRLMSPDRAMRRTRAFWRPCPMRARRRAVARAKKKIEVRARTTDLIFQWLENCPSAADLGMLSCYLEVTQLILLIFSRIWKNYNIGSLIF